jgi:hypothetical protein
LGLKILPVPNMSILVYTRGQTRAKPLERTGAAAVGNVAAGRDVLLDQAEKRGKCWIVMLGLRIVDP